MCIDGFWFHCWHYDYRPSKSCRMKHAKETIRKCCRCEKEIVDYGSGGF